MPGDMRSSREEVGVDTRKAMLRQCPDDSILLAYTRNQKIENPQNIRQHIQGCQTCRQKCDEYARLNATLDILASVQNNLSYSEPLAYEVIDVIRGGKRRRRKKQTNKLAVPSIRGAFTPIAFLVTIGTLIVVTAVAAFALTHTGNSIPNSSSQPGGELKPSTTVISQEQSTPRPKPTLPVLSPTPVVDPTPVVPYIELCTTPDDLAHSMMSICGHNFTPGDSVVLLIKMPGPSSPKQVPAGVVDAQGNFQDTFIINNCKVPLAVFAKDVNNQVSTNLLQNISFGNCPVPTTPSGAT